MSEYEDMLAYAKAIEELSIVTPRGQREFAEALYEVMSRIAFFGDGDIDAIANEVIRSIDACQRSERERLSRPKRPTKRGKAARHA